VLSSHFFREPCLQLLERSTTMRNFVLCRFVHFCISSLEKRSISGAALVHKKYCIRTSRLHTQRQHPILRWVLVSPRKFVALGFLAASRTEIWWSSGWHDLALRQRFISFRRTYHVYPSQDTNFCDSLEQDWLMSRPGRICKCANCLG
jgi:hypothetical protein